MGDCGFWVAHKSQSEICPAAGGTLVYDGIFKNVSADISGSAVGLYVSSVGNRLYIATHNYYDNNIREYSFSDLTDISTIAFAQSLNLSSAEQILDIEFTPDGSSFSYSGWNSASYVELTTNFDISTVSTSTGINLNNTTNSIRMDNDGNNVFQLFSVIGGDSDTIMKSGISPPWDTTSLPWPATGDTVGVDIAKRYQSITFNDDISIMYALSAADLTVDSFTLSTPADITTLTFDGLLLDISSELVDPSAMYMLDGIIYILDSSGIIFQYSFQ